VPNVVAAIGTTRTTMVRCPITFGSAPSNTLRVMHQGWISGPNGTSNIANSIAIVLEAIEYNGVVVPVTYSGSRTVTISPGDEEKLSDIITPAAFGLTAFNPGTSGFYRVETLLPADAASYAYANIRKNFNATPIQGVYLNKANTTITNGVDGTGVFTFTGAIPGGSTAPNVGHVPFFVGTFVRSDPVTIAFVGDSITAGNNDDNPVSPTGGGIAQRVMYGNGANILAGINLASSGSKGEPFSVSPNDRLAKLSRFARIAVEQLGINDLGVAGDTRTAANLLTYARTNWLKLRSYGIEKIIRCKITPRTTGSWTSDASQTIAPALDVGGNTDIFNNTMMPAEKLSGAIDALVEMSVLRSPTNQFKWFPLYTSDGLHPNEVSFPLVSAEVRLAVDAIAASLPKSIYDYLSYSNNSSPALLQCGAERVWSHVTIDSIATITTTGYFGTGRSLGMKVNDYVIVTRTAGTFALSVHKVTAISSDGKATVSAEIT